MAKEVELRSHESQPVVDLLGGAAVRPQLNEKDEQTTVLGEQEEASVVDKEDATRIAESMTNLAESMKRGLQFSVDEKSGEVTIKVTNTETGEVVREIPSMELGGISQEQYDSGTGLIFSGVV